MLVVQIKNLLQFLFFLSLDLAKGYVPKTPVAEPQKCIFASKCIDDIQGETHVLKEKFNAIANRFVAHVNKEVRQNI